MSSNSTAYLASYLPRAAAHIAQAVEPHTQTLLRTNAMDMDWYKKHMKVVLVGDVGVGKSSVIKASQTAHIWPREKYYMKDCSSGGTCSYIVESNTVKCLFVEATLANSNDVIDNAAVTVICFSLINRPTFESVRKHWVDCLLNISTDAVLVIVGTHMIERDAQERTMRAAARPAARRTAKAALGSDKGSRSSGRESSSPGRSPQPSPASHPPILRPSYDANSTAAACRWAALPFEVLLVIFQRLPPEDLAHVAQVCRRWSHVCRNEYLWRGKSKGLVSFAEVREFIKTAERAHRGAKIVYEEVDCEDAKSIKRLMHRLKDRGKDAPVVRQGRYRVT
eukprot:CAMPEP_0177669832 /NCGR_PEP_ID=MMETSP0447-20121125/23703_1 /TAXON_ID=0 /ORGANISM="Stygamoeba regulata, Strain BSH-02190019" /LENGTH=336 /DNA_ID=CAMNT_0019176829 /DNA_START=161 /DNA_END=1171 /DNA_ORIENTATION=+